MDETVRDARRTLNRLRRALEKAGSELDDVAGALRHAEGGDFPVREFEASRNRITEVLQFVDEQEQRLQEKILYNGGIEAGRLRRG